MASHTAARRNVVTTPMTLWIRLQAKHVGLLQELALRDNVLPDDWARRAVERALEEERGKLIYATEGRNGFNTT